MSHTKAQHDIEISLLVIQKLGLINGIAQGFFSVLHDSLFFPKPKILFRGTTRFAQYGDNLEATDFQNVLYHLRFLRQAGTKCET